MTIFAPSNEAFRLLRENRWTKNMTHDMMVKVLGRLVVPHRKLLPTEVRNEMMVETASQEKLRLNIYPKVKLFNFCGNKFFYFFNQCDYYREGENGQRHYSRDGTQCSI
jgi:hypothetical protein